MFFDKKRGGYHNPPLIEIYIKPLQILLLRWLDDQRLIHAQADGTEQGGHHGDGPRIHRLREVRTAFRTRRGLCHEDEEVAQVQDTEGHRVPDTRRTWVTLIANLLLMVMQKGLKRQWSFSGLATMTRITLMYYVDFFSLFNNPEKDWEYVLAEASERPPELTLFD